MTIIGSAQIAIVLVAVIAAAIPLSTYIARVLAGERTFLSAVLTPVERKQRDHDERRDHQHLVIVDVSNDLRLPRDHGVECGACGGWWTDSRTAR
jgi:hypothetical protein